MNSISDIFAQNSDDAIFRQAANVNDTLSEDQTTSVPSMHEATAAQAPDLSHLRSMVFQMKDQLEAMLRVLNGEIVHHTKIQLPESTVLETGERIIEGVFNGEKMVGADGKEYPVPPNYASKSKLVEGDMMKLTITNQGRFVYKQISTIERKRLVGELISDTATGQWSILADGKTYKVLTASVTFYRGKSGDEAFFLVPADGDSNWGAVENIISR